MTGSTARRARGALVVLVLVALPALAASPSVGATSVGTRSVGAATVGARAVDGAGGAGAGRREVIVSFDTDLAMPVRLLAASAASTAGAVPFVSGAGFVATLTAEQIDALRSLPGIAAVTPNQVLEPAALHHEQTGAVTAWASGWRGEGQRIAVVDTGVDATNPNLAGKLVAEACFTPRRDSASAPTGDCPGGTASQFGAGAAVPCTGRSDCFHGTHVASVAAADGPEVRGTAPGASILAVQVFSSVRTAGDRVVTDEGALVRALEWLEQQHRDRPIAAVNLSLGGGPVPTPCSASPALVSVIDRLTQAGTAVVASAGNDASPSMLSFPACLPNVVSVGAEGEAAAPASFANRAPSLTIFAPGESVPGAWGAPCCTRTLSGSSFAAPQVTAAFALLRQQGAPGSIAELVGLLRRTGEPLVAGPTESPAPTSALRLDRALDPRYQTPVAAALGTQAAPVGTLDVVAPTPAGLRVAGWAIDPDTVLPVPVHVYVDGVLAATTFADRSRPDVASAYAGFGDAHGYDLLVPVTDGSRTVCVYGIDVGPGPGNDLLACRSVDVRLAFGALDEVVATAGVLHVRGWAIDVRTPAPVDVEVLIDGVIATRETAADHRGDVGAAHAAYGAAHGFAVQVGIEPGVREVCVVASATVIGCRVVEVVTGAPFGVIDAVAPTPDGTWRVQGWAADPDTTQPIEIVLRVGGRSVAAVADGDRPDLAVGLPRHGTAHGFDVTVTAPAAAARVCLFGVDPASSAVSPIVCAALSGEG
jgi:hypothetical protein